LEKGFKTTPLSQNFQTIQKENIWKGSKILFQEPIFVLKRLE
jgi:hypothetical protein